jgi:hypothetical protein
MKTVIETEKKGQWKKVGAEQSYNEEASHQYPKNIGDERILHSLEDEYDGWWNDRRKWLNNPRHVIRIEFRSRRYRNSR